MGEITHLILWRPRSASRTNENTQFFYILYSTQITHRYPGAYTFLPNISFCLLTYTNGMTSHLTRKCLWTTRSGDWDSHVMGSSASWGRLQEASDYGWLSLSEGKMPSVDACSLAVFTGKMVRLRQLRLRLQLRTLAFKRKNPSWKLLLLIIRCSLKNYKQESISKNISLEYLGSLFTFICAIFFSLLLVVSSPEIKELWLPAWACW